MRRLPLVVAATWLTVLVGLLTNLVTGDSPPWWLWVLWAAGALALTAVELRRQRGSWSLLGGAPEPTPRDRARALRRSGEHVAAALREEFAAVRPLALSVRAGNDVSDSLVAAYDVDESLLVLGAAGAGKSTELLRLARVLARRAERANRVLQPVPVVLSLAGWGRRRRLLLRRGGPDGPPALLDWLLAQARTRYGVLPDVARAWLRQRQLVLLLDGVDEVRADLRAACVKAINELANDPAAPPLVVTSRTGEVEGLALARTATIEPLTPEQVERGLGALAGELRDLVDTPLWLRVARTAGRRSADPRRDLLGGYLAELLDRRGGSPAERIRLVRGIGLLVRAAERTDDPGAVQTRPIGPLPDEVAVAMRRWVTPALVAGLLTTGAVLPLARLGGLAAGLSATAVVTAFAWALRRTPRDSWGTRYAVDPVRTRARRLVGAAGGLVLGAAVGQVLGSTTVVQPANPQSVVLLVTTYITVTAFITVQYNHPGLRGSRAVAIIATVFLVGVYGSAMLLDAFTFLPAGLLAGLILGVLCAICCRAVVDASEGGVRSRFGSVHRIGWWAPVAASVGGLLAVGGAWLVGPPMSGPVAMPLLGLVVGLLGGYPLAPLTALAVGVCWWGPAAAWAGVLPWRTRRFLREAASCGLVAADGRRFRFPHLVLRDHLRSVDLVDGRVRAGSAGEPREEVLERVVRRLGARPVDVPRLLDPTRRFQVSTSPLQELDISGSRLVVCGPAAGTSAVLREIAHVLVDKARADATEPVAVLVDFATWPGPPVPGVVRPFTAWLLGRLREDYGIDPDTGLAWLADHRLVPLVDGPPADRAWYFTVVQEFRRAYRGLPIVLAGGAHDGDAPEGMVAVVVAE